MLAGLVEVNGEVVTRMGTRVDPARDVIRIEGRRLPPIRGHAYLMLNKPTGVVSTMADDAGRPDLSTLVQDRPDRLFHVGRLDTDTSGLLLLTNDGELAHRLSHPSFELTKTYVALVSGTPARTLSEQLRAGIELADGPARVDRFVVRDRSVGRSIVELDIHMGRNRVVRRLLAEVGHPVIELTRTGFGPLSIGTLGRGQARELTRDETGALFDSVPS